jgi:holliday junction DNA helicase RuvA
MIGTIRGNVTQINDKSVIIDVNGLGYVVYVSTDTLSHLHEGKGVALWTHLIVREDALDLYGFMEKNEKTFFELLIGVSGIGPRSALAILCLAPPDVLHKAIVSGNTDYLTKVSGIGKKSAEKIVLELKDKLAKLAEQDGSGLHQASEVLEALKAIGYSQKEAREAVQKLPAELTDTGEQIKEALKFLNSK